MPKDIKISITTEHDSKGLDEAMQGISTLQEQTAEHEHEAAEATRELGEAAEEAAEREEALRQYMELEARTIKELEAEVRRLGAERKGAAAAGDTESYKKLTAEMTRTKGALRDMTQQSNLSKAAMMGQATAGMQFAAGLQRLGEQAASGSTDIAGMATQVMALGMALKAGLGPIGMIMGALQGAQVLFEKWRSNKTEELNRQLEETREATERLKAAWQEAAEAGAAQRKALLDGMARDLQELTEKQSEKDRDAADAAARSAAEARSETQKRLTLAQGVYEKERQTIELQRARKQLTDAQASEKLREAEAKLREAQADTARAEERAREAAAEARVERARENLAEVEAAARKLESPQMQALLQIKMPSEAEVRALELRLAEPADTAEEAELQKLHNELMDKISIVRKEMEAMGVSTEGGYAAVAAFVRDLQETAKSTDKLRRDKEREVRLEEEKLKEEQRSNEIAAETRDELRRRAARQADIAREEEKNKQANKDANRELSHITSHYKLSRSYAEQDRRTQAEQLKSDGELLAKKKEELQRLQHTPRLDAETQMRINDALRETEKEQRGYEQAVRDARREAQRSMDNFRAPNITAKNRALQGALDNLRKAYERQARQAEKAAASGDDDGVERYRKGMAELALRMERLAGFSGQAEALHRDTVSKLQLVLNGVNETNRGKTAQQQQEERITNSLKAQARGTAEAAEATRREANAKKQAAAAAESSARAAAAASAGAAPTARPETAGADTRAQVASLTRELQHASGSLTRATQELSSATAAAGTLSEHAGALNTKAAELKAATASNGKLMAQVIATLGQAIAENARWRADCTKKIAALEAKIEKMQKF